MPSTDEEIRSNTIYTIGVLCSQSKNALCQFYVQIVNDLVELVKIEKSKQTLDNICGTLCRVLLSSIESNLNYVNYELVTFYMSLFF